MSTKNTYSQEDLEKIIDLHENKKLNYHQIADIMGRSYSSIVNFLARQKGNTATIKKLSQKSLSDYTPREMIKHLYNLGYRIENNEIVCIQKVKVNIKDIING